MRIMLELVDTHCHIHFPDYGIDSSEVIAEAQAVGVTKMLCVGTTLEDSLRAVEFVQKRSQCWATIGIHPHDADHYVCDAPTCLTAELSAPSSLLAHRGVDGSSAPSPYLKYGSVRPSPSPSAASKHKHNDLLRKFSNLANKSKVVAVGETGLDYYYNHSPKEAQVKILRLQIELGLKHDLPLIFHVREAFEDFWQVFDSYKGVRGVVHSFSATRKELAEVLERGLYVGLNGIMTFTKKAEQLEAAKAMPLQKLLLETDAPFLTPVPYRGTICQPKHLRVTAEFLADLRGESLAELAKVTTKNTHNLFKV